MEEQTIEGLTDNQSLSKKKSIEMEDADDEIPMILQSEKKPYRTKKTSRLFHENLTSGSGANTDQVNVTYRDTEHRQMSLKLTIVTLLVLISTLVFLILFLIVPLFYNLNHPLYLDAGSNGEETLERGHSHHSDGNEEHAGHGGVKEAEATDAEKMPSMESQKMNSDWIQRISVNLDIVLERHTMHGYPEGEGAFPLRILKIVSDMKVRFEIGVYFLGFV